VLLRRSQAVSDASHCPHRSGSLHERPADRPGHRAGSDGLVSSTPVFSQEHPKTHQGVGVVELTLVGVRIELPTQQPIVLLKERDGERFLPIWIGNVEATAIAFALQGVQTARPMTHDLLRNMLEELGASVDRVVITELKDGTFFANIELTQDDSSYSISSRPSDAIALAVRTNSTIYADEKVLTEASIVIKNDDEEREVEKFREFLDKVTPEDFE
jgi:bifunctional DNase/RNase